MRLYIVRHAIADPHGTPGIEDDDRDLTEEGIQKMRLSAAGLRSLGYIPELLISSPLIRAIRTAEILAEAFGKGVELKISQALAPAGNRGDFYREMEQYSKKLNGLMIVGHQPSLGEIAGEIAWGSPDHFIELKKGGACAIEVGSVRATPRGSLISLLTPSILRRVAD